MRQKSKSTPVSSEGVVRDIRRATRKHHEAEEKIRIVLDGLRGETSIAKLCRRHRSCGDDRRGQAAPALSADLKEVVAEQALELRLLKKSMIGDGEDRE